MIDSLFAEIRGYLGARKRGRGYNPCSIHCLIFPFKLKQLRGVVFTLVNDNGCTCKIFKGLPFAERYRLTEKGTPKRTRVIDMAQPLAMLEWHKSESTRINHTENVGVAPGVVAF